MLAPLPSNLIALPELPSISRRRDRRRYHDGVDRTGHWTKETGNFPTTNEKTFMKQTNHHDEEMTRYGNPLMGGGWRQRRGYPAINYNDRSPEVGAMNAQLRASAYPDLGGETDLEPASRLTNGAAVVSHRMKSFLHLGHQYDTKARDNFVREAILFALLVTLSAWAIISAVHALAVRW